jgi:hypothetical protein
MAEGEKNKSTKQKSHRQRRHLKSYLINSKWRNKNSRVTKTVSDGEGVVCVGGGTKMHKQLIECIQVQLRKKQSAKRKKYHNKDIENR